MRPVMTIDPVAVREEMRRQQAELRLLADGTRAAEALLWFREYAQNPKLADVVLLSAQLGRASAVEGARSAEHYLREAARQFPQMVLDEAVRLAHADLDAGSRSVETAT